jgi:hypothetical protein
MQSPWWRNVWLIGSSVSIHSSSHVVGWTATCRLFVMMQFFNDHP